MMVPIKNTWRITMNKFEVDDWVRFNFHSDCLTDLSRGLNGKKGKVLTKRNTSAILGEFNWAYIVAFDCYTFRGDKAIELNEKFLKPLFDNLKNGTQVFIRDGNYICNGVVIGKVWNNDNDQKYAIYFNNPRPNGLQITIQDRKEFVGVIEENELRRLQNAN